MGTTTELAAQAAPETQAEMARVGAAVALEEQGLQDLAPRAVTAAQALNQPYLVPPSIMAAVAAGPVE